MQHGYVMIRQTRNHAKNLKTMWSCPYGGHVRVFTFGLAITVHFEDMKSLRGFVHCNVRVHKDPIMLREQNSIYAYLEYRLLAAIYCIRTNFI